MGLEWSTGGGVTLASALGLLLLAGFVWRRHSDDGALWLTLALLANALWAVAYSLELASSSAWSREVWGEVKYVGICALPPTWFAFVSAYTGRGWLLRKRAVLLLAVEPLLVLGLLANEDTEHLIRYHAEGTGPRAIQTGPLFWPHSVYTYVLLWASTAILVVRLRRLSPIYRRQSTLLVATLAVPWVCNVLFNAGIAPLDRIDLTPFGFLLSGAVLVWGVLRFRLVRLRPIARSQVFMAIEDPVVALDPLDRAVDVNTAAADALGLPADQLIGQPVGALFPNARQAMDSVGMDEPVETTLGDRVFELRASPLTDRRDRALGTLLMAHDITERKDVESRLHHLALHDPLTGAANRTLYFDRLTHALDQAARSRRPVAVLFVDLDGFKEVNDALGHGAGDRVLVEVAERLRSVVRKADTVARIGGDEFALILEDIGHDADTERAVAQAVAHIREALCAPIDVEGRLLRVSGSVGVATGVDVEPDELVRRADEAMYAEKAAATAGAGVVDRLPRPRAGELP